jgi:seryl-tRNA synthetase
MELANAQAQFRAELISAGLLVPTSVDGLYGRSGAFEDIIEGIDRVVISAGTDQPSSRYRFPPVFPRADFDRTDYLASFPDLTGSIHTFVGSERDHAQILAIHAEGGDWGALLAQSDVMLASAACHPAYPMLSGRLPEGGRRLDILGYCFRHEPAVDPARMQAFRQHEYVFVGPAEGAQAHRDHWVDRGMEVLSALGLPATSVIANDPFFGRVGRMLAANQRDESLKVELVVHLYDGLGDGTAVVSCNCHLDHFGQNFDIETADGGVAHSACVGFGMERIALALLKHHGLDTAHWPASLREVLWS